MIKDPLHSHRGARTDNNRRRYTTKPCPDPPRLITGSISTSKCYLYMPRGAKWHMGKQLGAQRKYHLTGPLPGLLHCPGVKPKALSDVGAPFRPGWGRGDVHCGTGRTFHRAYNKGKNQKWKKGIVWVIWGGTSVGKWRNKGKSGFVPSTPVADQCFSLCLTCTVCPDLPLNFISNSFPM